MEKPEEAPSLQKAGGQDLKNKSTDCLKVDI